MWGKGVEMRSSADRRGGTRTRRLLAKALAAVAFVLTMAMPAAAEAANIGVDGPDFAAGVSGSPSGYKGESKLWFNDGFWWASMFAADTSAYHIFRLDKATQVWTDTGIETDNRDSSRQDTFWDGTHLWVSSHIFVENAGFNTTVNIQPMEFSRYSYNAGTDTYTLDFTVNIESDERSESLVFDQGVDGRFWATWVQQPTAGAGRQVLVSHTSGTCVLVTTCVWTAPEQIGGAAPDDVSAVIRFGASIGVMWSDQQVLGGEAYRFRALGAADVWGPIENASLGNKMADDHVNVKADAAGNVYAATKTKFFSPEKPQTRLLVRSAATGTWTDYLISPASNSRTRPIVVLDQENNTIHVFETGPHTTSSDGQSGGDIYEKVSRMDTISFAVSSARPVMRAEVPDVLLNNATSTKQSVTSATDILVLASSATGAVVKTYWHHFAELTGAPSPGGGGCTIRGTSGPDVLVGTARADVICGLGGNDQIAGLGGNDRITGGPGRDLIRGGAGRDLLNGGGGGDRLVGGAKADRLLGGFGNDKLLGSIGSDRLLGGRGRDVLTGGAGGDRLVGGGGRDAYQGGGGSDTLISRDRVAEVVNGGRGRDRARIDRGRDTPRSIEVLF
jgi:Ca2+-binding RTX toxin-like protein